MVSEKKTSLTNINSTLMWRVCQDDIYQQWTENGRWIVYFIGKHIHCTCKLHHTTTKPRTKTVKNSSKILSLITHQWLGSHRPLTWWRHQMETFSTLLTFCAVTGEFPPQKPVTRSFDVYFDLRLNKRLSKQSWGWWFETQSRPLWRHCNGLCHIFELCKKFSRHHTNLLISLTYGSVVKSMSGLFLSVLHLKSNN